MKTFNPFGRLLLGFLFWSAGFSALGAVVPEEAQRRMARGNAAVEMARSTEEYASAVDEYRQASELAPTWPDPHFNLGLIQEKMGRFGEAARSFRRYLELAPDAPEAARIREQIYKLEYKAEQTLSVADIVEVLSSGFSVDASQWRQKVVSGSGDASAPCGRNWSMQELFFRRGEGHAVKVLSAIRYYSRDGETYQTLPVAGPTLKYRVSVNVCDQAANQQLGGCDSIVEHEVEVVSKRLVRVRQTVLRQGSGAGSPGNGQRFACVYEKIS